MVQPAVLIRSPQEAADAARSVQSPVEVQRYEAMASESPSVRAFLATEEWSQIYARIMGDGNPPLGRPKNLSDVSRILRWTADGALSPDYFPTAEERRAYLHAATEIDAFARSSRRVAPVSPAPAPPVPAARRDAAGGLPFGEALSAVRSGAHITRAAWPAGTYVTAQAGYPQGIGINANTAAATGLPQGTRVAFRPSLMRLLPGSDGGPPAFMQWAPDQEDLFADDWRVLARG